MIGMALTSQQQFRYGDERMITSSLTMIIMRKMGKPGGKCETFQHPTTNHQALTPWNWDREIKIDGDRSLSGREENRDFSLQFAISVRCFNKNGFSPFIPSSVDLLKPAIQGLCVFSRVFCRVCVYWKACIIFSSVHKMLLNTFDGYVGGRLFLRLRCVVVGDDVHETCHSLSFRKPDLWMALPMGHMIEWDWFDWASQRW